MRLLFLILFAGILFTASADPKKDPVASGTLQEQFDGMIERSNRYQDFKVVKRTWLDRFNQNINDTLAGYRTEAIRLGGEIGKLNVHIQELEAASQRAKEQIASLESEKENMTFFGARMSKGAYKSTMWILSGLLAFMMLFFLLKFKNANILTVHAKEALGRTEEEFERFRKFAREREQTISRELQNEINKRVAS